MCFLVNRFNYISRMKKNIFIAKIIIVLVLLFHSENAFSKSFRIYEASGECESYRMEFDVRSMKYSLRFCDFPEQVFCLFKDSKGKWYVLSSSGKKLIWKEYSVPEDLKKLLDSENILCADGSDGKFIKLSCCEDFNPEYFYDYYKGLFPVDSGYLNLREVFFLPEKDNGLFFAFPKFKNGSGKLILKIPEGFYEVTGDDDFSSMPLTSFEKIISSENNVFHQLLSDKKKKNLTRFMLRKSLLKDGAYSHVYDGENPVSQKYLELAFSYGVNINFDFFKKAGICTYADTSLISNAALKKAVSFVDYLEKKKYCLDDENVFWTSVFSPLLGKNKSIYEQLKSFKNYLSIFSVIIPCIEKVRSGDLAVVYENNQIKKIFMVRENLEKYKDRKISDVLSLIKLYSFSDTIETKKMSQVISEDDNFCFVSMLIDKNEKWALKNAFVNGIENWNLFPADSPVEAFICKKAYEQTQQASSDELWPWIPNTGEWFYMTDFKIQGESENFQALRPVMDFCFKEARDYSYNPAETSSNIFTNQSDEFLLQILKPDGSVLASGNLVRKKTSQAYTFNTEDELPPLITDEEGFLSYKNGERFKIGIKCKTPSNTFCGDDLVLFFSASTVLSGCSFDVPVKNRFAVYDKKMLSRANLYIDENQSNNKKTDWNIVHPWNAPCSAEYEYRAPLWWSKEWGYNVWNRVCEADRVGTSINEHDMADGKQSVSIAPYSAFRHNGIKTAVRDCVSYDYNADDNHRAWDSPFDFNYKLLTQNKILETHFTKQAELLESEELSKPGVFPRNETSLFEGNTVSVSSLSEWDTTEAPSSFWQFYWKKTEECKNPYIPGEGFLFFQLTHPNSFKTIAYTSNADRTYWEETVFPEKFSAGTDCIAFALRSAKYEGNRYIWCKNNYMENGFAEGNCNFEKSVRQLCFPDITPGEKCYEEIINWKIVNGGSDSVNNNPSYFLSPADENGSIKKDFLDKIKKLFLYVTPGDIACYGDSMSSSCDAERNFGSHIGIIQNVDSEKITKALTLREIFDSVEIIESLYGQLGFGVIKRTMTQTPKDSSRDVYEHEKLVSSWFLNPGGELRAWTICRLIQQ